MQGRLDSLTVNLAVAAVLSVSIVGGCIDQEKEWVAENWKEHLFFLEIRGRMP